MAARAGNVPKKVFLHVENITGSGSPAGYRVYLNLPGKPHPVQMERFFVGIISMFGLEEASRPDQHRGGSGLHYAFDITKIADLPESKKLLESKKYTVTFEPRKQAPANALLSIGRISLYYQ
jgi:tyrosinase